MTPMARISIGLVLGIACMQQASGQETDAAKRLDRATLIQRTEHDLGAAEAIL